MSTIDLARLEEFLASPIGDLVNALQDAGRDLWIAGFTPDGRLALIVDLDNEQVTVAPAGTVSGLGRWECSKHHYATHRNVYEGRFPVR